MSVKASKKIAKVYPILKRVAKMSVKDGKNYFSKKAPRAIIDAVCECMSNTLHGNVPLTVKQKNKFKKHKPIIKRLANRKTSVEIRRKLLSSQKGGFVFGPVLAAALPAIGLLIAESLKRK